MDSGPLIPVNGQVLREVQPDHPIELNRQLGPSAYSTLPGHDSALREYLRVLIKRKWLVASCVVIIFGVVALATMRSTRIYDAFGSIAINKTDPAIQSLKDPGTGSSVDYYDPTDLDTEVRILKSDLLALQVIKQLNLDKNPEVGGGEETPSNSLSLTTDALQPDSEKTTALLAGFKGGLSGHSGPQYQNHRNPLSQRRQKSRCQRSEYPDQHLHRAELQDPLRIHDAGLRLAVETVGRSRNEGARPRRKSWFNTRKNTKSWASTKNKTSPLPNWMN